MRRLAAFLIVFVFIIGILAACGTQEEPLSPAIEFRAKLAQSGCTFHADVTADLGETAVQFAMDCAMDTEGTVRLTVTEPERISGITATVAADTGKLTYDGMALDFGLLANGNVVPAAAPAIAADYRAAYERDFDEKCLFVDTWFENAVPICAEVCYNGQRILKIQITEFQFQ